METELNPDILTYKKIFLLWIPLAAMWLVMGIELPLINAVIARLDDAKANLAAFGITISIALIIESPVIQLLSAGTALTDSRNNYKKLMIFMHFLAIGMTFLHLLIGLTPIYNFLLREILGVPENIIPVSRKAFLWMFPWAAAVGYRRLWQGILIRYKKTKIIPITMAARLTAMSIVLLTGFNFTNLSGAEIGALALSCGVIAGAVSSYLYLIPIKRNLKESKPQDSLSWSRLMQFYYPLALTSFVTFIVRPVISFGLARAAFPLESLAVWPVVISFMFIFRSMAMAYQEVVVSLLKSNKVYRILSDFSLYLGLALTAGLLLIAVTPLSTYMYKNVTGLGGDLLGFTKLPTIIIALIPVLTSVISWYRGALIFKHRTGTIARAVFINSAVLLAIILAGPFIFDVPGAVIAAIAYTFSMLVESIFLKIKVNQLS